MVGFIFVYLNFLIRYGSLLLLIPLYGRTLGVSEYGIVLSAMSLMNIVWMIVNFGFSVIGTRDIARANNREDVFNVVSDQISGRIVMLFLGLTVGVILIFLIENLRTRFYFSFFFILLGFLNGFNVGWYFQGKMKYLRSVSLEIIPLVLNVAIVLIFIRGPGDSGYIPFSLLSGAIISTTIGYALVLRDVGKVQISFRRGIALIASTWPVFTLNLNATITSSGSTMLIVALSSPIEAAYFATAERVLSFLASFLQPTSQIFVPLISGRGAKLGKYEAATVASILQISFAVMIAIGLWFFADLVIFLIFGPSPTQAGEALRVIGCAIPFIAITHAVNMYYFVPQGFERAIALTSSVTNAVNFTVLIFSSSSNGAIGGGVARLIAEISASLLAVALLKSASSREKIF